MGEAKVWSALPEDIRCEKSIRAFETQLESINLSASTTLFLNDRFYFVYIIVNIFMSIILM